MGFHGKWKVSLDTLRLLLSYSINYFWIKTMVVTFDVFTDILAGFTFKNRVLLLRRPRFLGRNAVFNKNDCWEKKNSVVMSRFKKVTLIAVSKSSTWLVYIMTLTLTFRKWGKTRAPCQVFDTTGRHAFQVSFKHKSRAPHLPVTLFFSFQCCMLFFCVCVTSSG